MKFICVRHGKSNQQQSEYNMEFLRNTQRRVEECCTLDVAKSKKYLTTSKNIKRKYEESILNNNFEEDK